MTELTLITDEQLEKSFKNTDFGILSNRDCLNSGLLKVACGYKTGYTIKQIMIELDLVTPIKAGANAIKLTKRGQEYLYAVYSMGFSV